ncbi:hypothetical protein BRADI_5g22356v3 [Brachypodium distachyon]|uniref:BTB domain-containing protein n=1 Tax=Brachypodium distachyon TaxID=15368 RepID=A0A2K2CIM8_BRADI|nr:hypothetical protein BRADI_5g22356v3 [Brachypodium distachyon]
MANKSTSVVTDGQCQSETSSSCFTESFTTTHNFEVTGYSLLDGIGVGKSVSSSTFSVGGHDWNIRFYPDGNSKISADSTSVFLYHLGPAKDVRTKFTLNMSYKEGKEVANFGALEHTFSPESDNWGYPDFVKKVKLKPSPDINSGCLMIRCVLIVIVIREPHKRVRLEAPDSNLKDHLRQMWKDGQGADVTFSVGGQMFNAHRCLLAARSPVFKAELFGPMKEKELQCIQIDDIEPAIFEALLHFVYTDSMPDDERSKEDMTSKLQHLLVVADRYGLDKLRVLCESKLCENMEVETVATTLVLAEQHHCKDLQEACLEFMAPLNVLRAVMATDRFKHLLASCPLVMKDILDKVCLSDDSC